MNPSASENSAPSAARRSNRRRPKRWLPWLGAAVLVALIVIGFMPQPLPVETARVTQGALRATVNEEGKEFGTERLTTYFQSKDIFVKDLSIIHQDIIVALDTFKGTKGYHDDITILSCRVG